MKPLVRIGNMMSRSCLFFSPLENQIAREVFFRFLKKFWEIELSRFCMDPFNWQITITNTVQQGVLIYLRYNYGYEILSNPNSISEQLGTWPWIHGHCHFGIYQNPLTAHICTLVLTYYKLGKIVYTIIISLPLSSVNT